MARDILVGKVPDPKSQVEQITIALEVEAMARAYKQGSIGYTACVGCSQCGENLPDDVELYGRCRACNPLETFCERSECGCATRFGALSHEEVDSK